MLKLSNKFYIVRLSPYPLLLSLLSGNILLSLIIGNSNYILLSILISTIGFLGWINEIKYESIIESGHSYIINNILYNGFILFLFSEILIFSTLFGSYFYNILIPSIELYNSYPYLGIIKINALSLPLLNTCLLYISGLTITICINNLSLRNKWISLKFGIYTIILSIIFTFIQYIEYNNTLFSIIDGIYGTNFFILTGFHGIHVIIGTLFIIYSLIRIYYNYINYNNIIGIICSSLYWHFVDYVWIILYLTIYIY